MENINEKLQYCDVICDIITMMFRNKLYFVANNRSIYLSSISIVYIDFATIYQFYNPSGFKLI